MTGGDFIPKYRYTQSQLEHMQTQKWLSVRECKVFDVFYRDRLVLFANKKLLSSAEGANKFMAGVAVAAAYTKAEPLLAAYLQRNPALNEAVSVLFANENSGGGMPSRFLYKFIQERERFMKALKKFLNEYGMDIADTVEEATEIEEPNIDEIAERCEKWLMINEFCKCYKKMNSATAKLS